MAFDELTDAGEGLAAALEEARRLLRAPAPVDPAWPAVAAAALFAICAMIFATTAILTPPPKLPQPVAAAAPAPEPPPATDLRGPA